MIVRLIIVIMVTFTFIAASCPAFAVDTDPPPPNHTAGQEESTPSPPLDLDYSKIKDQLPQSTFETTDDVANRLIGTEAGELGNKLLRTLSVIVGVLAVFGMVISGIMYITAGSDPGKAEKAKNSIIWIITGVVIYILAFWFLGIVARTIGNP